MDDNLNCFYLDHTFFHAEKIGKLFVQLPKVIEKADQNKHVFLMTCQRVEIFTTNNKHLLTHLDLPFKKLSGNNEIINRLISIVLGVQSQILGEKNIIEQVKRVENNLNPFNPFKDIFLTAINSGISLRHKYDFNAEKNYEELAIQLLNTNVENKKKNLLVIGSGMLAKGILLTPHVYDYYDKIFFLSRSSNSLKKFIRQIPNVEICNTESIKNKSLGQFDAIIATTNVNEEYKVQIAKLLNIDDCLGVYDFTSVPLFNLQERTFNYYSDHYQNDYLDLVKFYNNKVVKVVNNIRQNELIFNN